MDGYAVRAADVAAPGPPVTLRVVGTVPPAWPAADSPVGPGEAIRIMTGAPIPPGADAVVMVERTDGGPDGDTVRRGRSRRCPRATTSARPATTSSPATVVLEPGTVLSPGHLGVLATRRSSARSPWCIRGPGSA